jgi:hypothetical protein
MTLNLPATFSGAGLIRPGEKANNEGISYWGMNGTGPGTGCRGFIDHPGIKRGDTG